MNENLVTIDIIDNVSLLEACDILHDARCDLSTLHVDLKNSIFKVRFEREFLEDPKVMTHERKLFVFTKTTFPFAEMELTLTGFKNYRIENNARIEIFTFNECHIDHKIVTLQFCEDMKIILEFDGELRGNLIDLKLLDKMGSMYTTGVREFRVI